MLMQAEYTGQDHPLGAQLNGLRLSAGIDSDEAEQLRRLYFLLGSSVTLRRILDGYDRDRWSDSGAKNTSDG